MRWHDLFFSLEDFFSIFFSLFLSFVLMLSPLIWNSFVREQFTCAMVLRTHTHKHVYIDHFPISPITILYGIFAEAECVYRNVAKCQVVKYGKLVCKYDGRMFTLRYINSDVILIAKGVIFAAATTAAYQIATFDLALPFIYPNDSSLVVNQYPKYWCIVVITFELNKFV